MNRYFIKIRDVFRGYRDEDLVSVKDKFYQLARADLSCSPTLTKKEMVAISKNWAAVQAAGTCHYAENLYTTNLTPPGISE